jgi:exonuclease III
MFGCSIESSRGVDANSPKLDHLDPNKVDLFNSDSRRMFGSVRGHQARDAYRDYRALHPDERWAFTHKGYRSKPVRFDHIWVTNEVKIGRVKTGVMQVCPSLNPGKLWHLDETGTEAISDHAWVAAELSIQV